MVLLALGNLIYFKAFEEKELIQRFGDDYQKYKNNVSMLFPRLTPYKKDIEKQ